MFLWTIYTRGLTAVGKINVFFKKLFTHVTHLHSCKSSKSMYLLAALFLLNRTIQNRVSDRTSYAPPEPAFKLHGSYYNIDLVHEFLCGVNSQ